MRSSTAPPAAAALRALTHELAAATEASACALSRVLGELLVQIVVAGELPVLGQGYLVPDYPLTAEVLETGGPRVVDRREPGADRAEVRLLDELGFDALLMLRLDLDGRVWGLVELYRHERPFGPEDVARAVELLGEAAARLSAPA